MKLEKFKILNILNKKINSYYHTKDKVYNVYMFPEFKYALYLPFKYTDGVPIQCIYG